MVDAARRHTAFRIVTQAIPVQGGCSAAPLAAAFHLVTIWRTIGRPMSSLSSELEWAARLSGQLETLSELAESLTYRVLELEDRVARQDGHLSSLQEASDALSQGIGEGIEARMRDTDDRLARIEQLLQGEGTRGSYSRSLRAVPKARTDQHDLASSSDETEEQVVFLDDTLANFPGEMTDAEDPPFEEDPSLLDDLVDQSLAS